MPAKTKKLVLKKSAPDEVLVTIGMEFKQTFKRANEPFSLKAKIANSLLSHYDFFLEFEETEPEVLTLSSLTNLKRDELDKLANDKGVKEPENLPNKKAVAEAILATIPATDTEEAEAEKEIEADTDEKSKESSEES